MNLLALFPLAFNGHPGRAVYRMSPNIYGNGMNVLIDPFWACWHPEPPHPWGPMSPTTTTARVFFNGTGAGWVMRSVAPCGARIYNGKVYDSRVEI